MTRALVVLLVLWCWCARRDRLTAPPGWLTAAARPDGSYELEPVLGRPQDDLEDARARRQLPGPDAVRGWLYCTGGATLRQDGHSVWCQR